MSITGSVSGDRMMGYLPPYWHKYLEMQQILKSQGIEFDNLLDKSNLIFTEAFIMTASETRIREWEKWLGLSPTGTLEDRRLAVLAYFSVVSKLTKESIRTLVSSLYKGARSIVRFEDSTIKITIKPLPEYDTETLDFTPLLNQLEKRKPCHISLNADRYIGTWGDIDKGFSSWQEVATKRKTWQEVYDFILE